MKHSVVYLITISFLFITLTAGTMSDDGRAGAVGSPGENTCNTNNCHNSFASNSGGGYVRAFSTMNNWTYDPMTTYTIGITVAKSGVALFGVGAEILSPSNTNAGVMTITDAARTGLKSAIIAGVSRRSFVHKLNGGASQDSMVFTFNWTSPDTSVGPLSMYFCGNAANSDNDEGGDYIYTGFQAITPATGNSISNIKTIDALSVYPNPATDFVNLHYNLKKNENVIASLYDINGELVKQLFNEIKSAGAHNDRIALPLNCNSGIYFLRIESDNGKSIRKILIGQ